jgi:SulP family sulfate permease
LLAPYAANIPLCALAAILFVVAYNMSDVPHFVRTIKHAPRYDVLILLVTFLLTVFTNLVVAVNVGVVLAMLFFVRRMHQSVIIEQQKPEALRVELAANGMPELPADTMVYTIQGPFFFGAAEKIEHALATTHTDPKVIIFRLKDVPFMDMTGLETFDELIEHYHKRGVEVYLCEANSNVVRKLTNVGILQWVADNRVFNNFAEILKFLDSRTRTIGRTVDN